MKNIFFLTLLFFSFGLSAQTQIKNVDATTFKTLVDENKSVLIDLRTNEEIASKGIIKGALQIDYFSKTAEAQIEKLDKKKTYLIYCAGGGRSGECVELMKKMGFTNVVNLEKGFDDWKRKGYEIEKK
jgi:phage shock protein E